MPYVTAGKGPYRADGNAASRRGIALRSDAGQIGAHPIGLAHTFASEWGPCPNSDVPNV